MGPPKFHFWAKIQKKILWSIFVKLIKLCLPVKVSARTDHPVKSYGVLKFEKSIFFKLSENSEITFFNIAYLLNGMSQSLDWGTNSSLKSHSLCWQSVHKKKSVLKLKLMVKVSSYIKDYVRFFYASLEQRSDTFMVNAIYQQNFHKFSYYIRCTLNVTICVC